MKTAEFSKTDVGNAQRLVAGHGDIIRWCPQLGGWLHWTGKVWETNGYEVERLAKETIRAIHEDAKLLVDDEERRKLIQHALRSESVGRIKAMVELAKSETGIAADAAMFDADPMVLNVQNGTIDLKTGELRGHRREDHLTMMAQVDYIESAQFEMWDRFLEDATGGDVELKTFLQRFAGYSLTGQTVEEKLLFIYGKTATGKSTFAEALKKLLGPYAATADFETFLQHGNNSGPRSDIARLRGARVVWSVETEDGRKLAESLIKQLTGGDTVTARQLYREHFEFLPTFKLALVSNYKPRVRDDDAIWRRILVVPFDRQVPLDKRDPAIKETLRSNPAARSAILAWAVLGCIDWQQHGLGEPGRVTAATNDYRQEMDPLADFFEEVCEFGEDRKISSEELKRTYLEWHGENPAQVLLTDREMAQRLRAKGCAETKLAGGKKRGWKGISLKAEGFVLAGQQDGNGRQIP